MPDLYVRSSDGSDADNGSTWALAKATLAGAAAIDAAGDRIFLASTHLETTAANVTIALAGTGPAPTLVASVNDAAAPPSAVAAGATVRASGASSTITFTGTAYHLIGLTLVAGVSATSGINLSLQPAVAGYAQAEGCSLQMASTGASSRVQLPGTASTIRLSNTTVRFSAAGQGISSITGAILYWDGGGVEAGSAAITTLFPLFPAVAFLSGLDLSACASTLTIFTGQARAFGRIRNSRLPAGWTGALASSVQPGDRYEMLNCDAGDTNYRVWTEEYAGSVRSETTIVRDGGATDGTVPYSLRMASNANAEWPVFDVRTLEISRWNATDGSPITASVEIISDGLTLNDDEIWLEVQHLGTNGVPLGSVVTDAKAHALATAAAQTSSSATWTTTGLTTPVRQRLSVTFTPQSPGMLQAVVHLARPSTIVYVDPQLTIT